MKFCEKNSKKLKENILFFPNFFFNNYSKSKNSIFKYIKPSDLKKDVKTDETV